MKNVKTVKIFLRELPEEVDLGDGVLPCVLEVNIDFSNRLNLTSHNFKEDGVWYNVNNWDRKDGKIDKYNDILIEAINNGLN